MEKTQNTGLEYLPYKFMAKELDEETGLYYYGARYLDPKYSMWISTDPALGDYIPKAPINEEAKKHNQNLPGMGGVFNHINGDLYAYAGNNPVRYIDPTGEFSVDENTHTISCDANDSNDLKMAQREFSKNKLIESCIAKDTNSNTTVSFPSANSMKDFIKSDGFKKVKELEGVAGDIVGAASIFKESLGTLGNKFSYAAMLFDGMEGVDSFTDGNTLKTIDKTTDVVIDFLGTLGPEGVTASIFLKYSKSGLYTTAYWGALASKFMERKIINDITQFYFGVNIK